MKSGRAGEGRMLGDREFKHPFSRFRTPWLSARSRPEAVHGDGLLSFVAVAMGRLRRFSEQGR
jgi:hypothetical protein